MFSSCCCWTLHSAEPTADENLLILVLVRAVGVQEPVKPSDEETNKRVTTATGNDDGDMIRMLEVSKNAINVL